MDAYSEKIPPENVLVTNPETFQQEVLPYLFPSPSCQSDRLRRPAFDHFGNPNIAWENLPFITNGITTHLSPVSGSTDSSTSAIDSMVGLGRACRGLAHVGNAQLRAIILLPAATSPGMRTV